MGEIARSAIWIEEGDPSRRGQEGPAGGRKSAGGKTVLLVEDETLVRRVVQAMLERLGHDVLTAQDGVDAVDMFRNHADHIYLVISDLHLPRMDGWDVMAAVRRMRPGIPVILASGDCESATMLPGVADRSALLLPKPFELASLRRALEQSFSGDRGALFKLASPERFAPFGEDA